MTPNFVIAEMPPRPRQEGFQEAPSWPLAEVDAETLDQMWDEFRAGIFRKAGKSDPRQNASMDLTGYPKGPKTNNDVAAG